jgi:uncharacterized membrane protein
VVFEFWRSGLVLRFPTLIVSVLLMLLGIMMVVTGIILDVLAEQDRKRFVIDSNMAVINKRYSGEYLSAKMHEIPKV